MVFGGEPWNLKTVEVNILRRTERAMIRRMCRVRMKDRKDTLELMERLGLKESVLQTQMVVVRRSGHALRREEEDPIKMAWELAESVARGRGRPKMT